MGRSFFSATLLALVAGSVARADSTINVGNYLLLPNTPGQVIQIPVTGTDQAPGADLAVQVGDGGPQLKPSGTPGPTIANIGLTTGTIFAVNGAVQFTPPGNLPQVWFTDVALDSNNPPSVAASGVLADLTIDTTGFSNGSFALLLKNVAPNLSPPNGSSTDLTFAVPNLTINNGSITVVPVPTAAYWKGNVDGNWSTGSYSTGITNWKTDAGGATDTHAAPAAVTDVSFVTTGGGSNLSTTLDADFSIKGLTFTSAATSAVSINGNHTLTLGVDGLTMQAGAASPTIGSSVAVGANQAWTVNGGNPLTVSGAVSLGAVTLTKAGTGTLRVNAAPILGTSSALVVSAGTLRFNIASGAAVIGTGVTATVASGATLELAGSVSALAAGSNRVNITNSSRQSSGGSLLVSGTNQQVGGINGAGDTVVNAGASLTANHIIQNALVIGGTAATPALVTIDASDSTGNPLAASSGSALADSLAPSASFGAGLGSSNLLAVGESSPASGLSASGSALGSLGGSVSAVPEPSTLLLLGLGILPCLLAARHKRRLAA